MNNSDESGVERPVSASELAQMGRCERLVAFEHLHGKRRTKGRQHGLQRGLLAHEQFEREGLQARAADAQRQARHSVANRVFGEASWQTRVLHQFKQRETPNQGLWGRGLIGLYSHAAPAICAWLCRWPVLQKPVRLALGAIAIGLQWWMGRRDRER